MWLAEKSNRMAEPGGGRLAGWGSWALFQQFCFFFRCWLGPHRADRYIWAPFHGPCFKRKFSLVFLVCSSRWLWFANQGAVWLEPHSTFGSGFSSCQVSAVPLYHGNSLHVVFDSAIQIKHSLSMWRRKASSYEPLAENDHTVIQPVQLPSHTSAPLHPGYRDHKGKASKWETHHSCTYMYTRIHIWRQREWVLGLGLAKVGIWELISRLMWFSNEFIPTHAFKVKCNRRYWIWILNSAMFAATHT